MILVPVVSVYAAQSPDWMPEALSELETALVAQFGESQQERIVDQTIPEMVVNNPLVDWDPYSNEALLAATRRALERVRESADS